MALAARDPPRRRIEATVTFSYLVTWDSFDTSQ